MNHPPGAPPYFDLLFSRITDRHHGTTTAFGRHVHWGFWHDPSRATCDPVDYAEAAERLCALVCDSAEIDSGQFICDVGCGFGGTIARLNELHTGTHLTGINIDDRQLERANAMVTASNGNEIAFIHAAAERLPLDDSSCDVLLSVEAVFHFDRRAFFAEAARVLKPGGRLALSDFVPDERMVKFLQKAKLSSDEAVQWAYGDIDLTYSVNAYKQLATEFGLNVQRVQDITEGTLPTYPFLYSNMSDWPDPVDVERFTRATLRLEKASRKKLLHYMILSFVKS